MKRILAVNLIIFVTLLTSTCSYSANFLVINSSDSPLEIEYIITEKIPIEQTWSKPLKMSLSTWNKWFGEKKWLEVSKDEYSFDMPTRKCKLVLSPSEVINFNRETESFDEEYKYFKIEYLKIKGNKGEMIFQEKDFYKQFQKKDSLNYFIDYK